MGVATCSQIDSCAQLADSRSSCGRAWAQPPGLSQPPGESGPGSELEGLSYTPLPPPDTTALLEDLLGNRLPPKPKKFATGALQNGLSLGSSTSRSDLEHSCARPGEPVNKVYVQFSNDLEGFLPYTLVISEEMGLEFTSLSRNPDFPLNPLNVMRINKLSYDDLMRDSFFISLSKSVLARPELWPGGKFPKSPPDSLPRMLEERVRPPYLWLVQLSVRRPILEGGQVIVFIAVQCDALGSELIRSCNQLRRRRAVRHFAPEPGARAEQASSSPRSSAPSRGFPTTAAPAASAVGGRESSAAA